MYIPYGFSEFSYPKYTKSVQEFPDLGMVIMSSFVNEEGVNGIKIGYAYDDIPENIRSAMKSAAVNSGLNNYCAVKYYNGYTEVYVMRLKPGETDDSYDLDETVCGLIVTGSRYASVRGLRVGKADERAKLLFKRRSYSRVSAVMA